VGGASLWTVRLLGCEEGEKSEGERKNNERSEGGGGGEEEEGGRREKRVGGGGGGEGAGGKGRGRGGASWGVVRREIKDKVEGIGRRYLLSRRLGGGSVAKDGEEGYSWGGEGMRGEG